METEEFKINIVIFSQSYPEIENCLYVLKTHYDCQHNILLVIPFNYDYYLLMTEIIKKKFNNLIKIIFIKKFNITSKIPFKSFFKAAGERIYNNNFYERHLAQIKSSKIYFFTRFCVPLNLYLLKKLKKNNELIYMYLNIKRTFQELDTGYGEGLSNVPLNNIRELLLLLRLKFVYGFDSKRIKIIINNVPYIPDKFMLKNVDNVISKNETSNLLKKFNYYNYNVFDTKHFKIIYFDQGYFVRKKNFKYEYF